MEISSISPRTRAILLRYEGDRPVPNEALHQANVPGEIITLGLQPWGSPGTARPEDPAVWKQAFDENDRFADQLIKKEAELGVELPVYLFGRAPLALMLHLGFRLKRRQLTVYQEQQTPAGTWVPGFDTALAPSIEPYFQVDGLPAARQGGRGQVALILEVTRDIFDSAHRSFQANDSTELLATVRMRAARGLSHNAVLHPGEVSRAVKEFQGVLDAIHDRLPGTESVLLAMSCPGGFAAALGTAVNPDAQSPIQLHQYLPSRKDYLPVHLFHDRHRRSVASTPQASREQILEASAVLENVREVHQDLVEWLKEPEQSALKEALGGDALLRSKVNGTPAMENEPTFRYLGDEWTFHVDLLLGLKKLRDRLGSPGDWQECVRFLLVHEAFHVRQGGLTSYNYSGSGRTGWVLEAVDFDADVVSFQAALAHRRSRQSGTVRKEGTARTMERIVWNALESLRVFEPERPVVRLSERRLRRYLIWLFHACRLHVLSGNKELEPSFDRVFVEVAGLPTSRDPHESYLQQSVELDKVSSADSLGFALYFRQKLVRERDGRWIANLLQAFSRWEEEPRERAQRGMELLFEQFFDWHRFLVDRE